MHVWGGGGSARFSHDFGLGFWELQGALPEWAGKVSGCFRGEEASGGRSAGASSSCNGMVGVEQELASTENSRRGGLVSNAVVFVS